MRFLLVIIDDRVHHIPSLHVIKLCYRRKGSFIIDTWFGYVTLFYFNWRRLIDCNFVLTRKHDLFLKINRWEICIPFLVLPYISLYFQLLKPCFDVLRSRGNPYLSGPRSTSQDTLLPVKGQVRRLSYVKEPERYPEYSVSNWPGT